MLRPCLAVGCPKLTHRVRCADHSQRYERQRGTPAQRGYDAEYRRLRAQVIAAQGWCTVCYTTEQLTVDHIVPLSRGGASTLDNLRTVCRFHNTQKGAN